MQRNEFIKTCGFACLGATAFSALLQSCSTANYFARFTLTNNQIAIKKSEFVKTSEDESAHRKYVLLETDKYGFPIGIYKTGEDDYSALLMECTHKGCELQPHGNYLICPCHGSEFSNTGVVQNPPAEENLKTFQVKTDHENIYIML